MAKVILTFMDGELGSGHVKVTCEFDPPITEDSEITPAQSEALRLMEITQNDAEKILNITTDRPS